MLTFNAKFTGNIDVFIQSIEPAANAALDAMATRALQAKDREVAKTYSRPIPRGKNGKAKWQRSGDWREGQKIIKKPMQRIIADTGNAAKPIKNHPGGYAEKLAKLTTARKNPAAENAFRTVEPQLEEIGRREFENHLRLNG